MGGVKIDVMIDPGTVAMPSVSLHVDERYVRMVSIDQFDLKTIVEMLSTLDWLDGRYAAESARLRVALEVREAHLSQPSLFTDEVAA